MRETVPTSRNTLSLVTNPDLVVDEDGRESWNAPSRRRQSFHNLHSVVRYGMSLRARERLVLRHDIDRRIGDLSAVRKLTGTSMFSAMVVLRGPTLVYEKYAPDFPAHNAHSVMSISKTMTHLIIGRLRDEGLIDTSKTVAEYLPEIGSGYAGSTVQAVLDMNVANDYSEDYSDPNTTALLHEAAMGWRLPPVGEVEPTDREFLCTIASNDITNHSGEPDYKSANTDVLGWIAERVSGRPLRDYFVEIVDAAGLEHTFYMSTDRTGVPNLNGGVCLSARDLARYGLIFVRGGQGVRGEVVGSKAFLEQTLECNGPSYAEPESAIHYCNQLRTNGRWVGHGGWGGQFLYVDPSTETVVVFFSVLENDSASDWAYQVEIIAMADEISLLEDVE